MLFTIGDAPAEPLEVGQSAYDPSGDYLGMSAQLFAPDGTLVKDLGRKDFVGGVASYSWGNSFLSEGVHQLRIVLFREDEAGTYRRSVPAIPVSVEAAISSWLTVPQFRKMMTEAPRDDFEAYQLLQVAKDSCLAYAPLEDPTVVPERYRKAQALQAREIWNFGKKSPATGDFGEGQFATAVFPLDRVVKQVLRPQQAIGRIVRG